MNDLHKYVQYLNRYTLREIKESVNSDCEMDDF